jgi:hypothetical protein
LAIENARSEASEPSIAAKMVWGWV